MLMMVGGGGFSGSFFKCSSSFVLFQVLRNAPLAPLARSPALTPTVVSIAVLVNTGTRTRSRARIAL